MPISERSSITWKTLMRLVASRPATVRTTMQASHPAIHAAAFGMDDGLAASATGLAAVQHVIDVEVALAERPLAAERAVDHADDLLRLDMRVAQAAHHFGGLEELAPVVGAARQPAHHVLGAGDCQGPGLGGPVQCRQEHQAARPGEAADRLQEQIDIGYVLDDL